jgi:sialidase-1
MRTMLSIAAGLALSLASAAAQPPPLTTVFAAAHEGYSCFRIPALLSLGGGELLAFAEGRKLSCADHGWNDLVSKRSLDGGASWGALQVVRSESAGDKLVTVGNPAPLLLASGALLLPFCRNNLEVGVLRSDDRGHSWRLSANVSVPPGWTWVATGPPGSIEVLRGGGRLVVPINFVNASVADASTAFLSDDGGESWRLADGIVRGGNENQVAELAWRSNATTPSVLHMTMRSAVAGSRLAAESADAGETWGEPWPTISETKCEGSVFALPRSRRLVMSSAFAAQQRANMTLHVSADDGHSWAPAAQVFDGPSAYSSLADLSPQSGAEDVVGLLFEQGPTSTYQTISFARVALPAGGGAPSP